MKNEFLNGKDNIILAAVEVMDQFGVHGLTIRELANHLQVTDGTIYRHFKDKQEVIMAVLEFYANFDSRIINTIKDKDLKTKDKIGLFIKSYVEYFENYSAITSLIFTYDSMKYDPILAQKVNNIFDLRYCFLNKTIKEGQEKCEITKRFSSEELTNLIIGLKLTLILKWRMSGFKFKLKDTVMSTLESFMETCEP